MCHMSFNEGRKLGGHVSRAHKEKNQNTEGVDNLEEEVQADIKKTCRRKTARRSKMITQEIDPEDPEVEIKMEEMEVNDIYEDSP